MLEHSVLRLAEIFVLVAVVHASDLYGMSKCLHAKLDFELKGIDLFEVPANGVSGIIIPGIFKFYYHASACSMLLHAICMQSNQSIIGLFCIAARGWIDTFRYNKIIQ